MIQTLTPLQKPLDATVLVPGSKSISNRVLLLAALANGHSTLKGLLSSDDTKALVVALNALGVSVRVTSDLIAEVAGCGGQFPKREASVYCHEAGTVTRFLIPAVATQQTGLYEFSASPRMSERPLEKLLMVLEAQGAQFEYLMLSGCMPFKMRPATLKGGGIPIDISESSQFLSGLMMAAPLAKQSVILTANQAIHSKPYVLMTQQLMLSFGVESEIVSENSIRIEPQVYCAKDLAIEPDMSTASYFFAAAAIMGGKVHVKNISRQCLQGDIRFLEVLEKMGCVVEEAYGGISVVGTGRPKALDIDMAGFTDTFMTVAAVAAFADGPTTLYSLAHTKLQESDRIESMAEGLRRLGVGVETTNDSIRIIPGELHGGAVSSYNDHRIAMSLALIGLKVPGVEIHGAEAVSKTCPDYFKLMNF